MIVSLCEPSSWVGPFLSRTLLVIPTSPSSNRSTSASCAIVKPMAANRATVSPPPKRPISAFEARVTLVFALASQASSLSQRLLADFATETAKYVFPKRFESRNLEEALMAVLSRRDRYEIREVEPYYIAETTMPGKTGFDFNGASQSFNVLAEYLFGKNTTKEQMEMTTPVYTRKSPSDGEKMEMTTPVMTKKVKTEGKWQMSFVMPSKYGANLPSPRDPSVRIKEVPQKIVAVVAFSGFVTDEEVKQRELKLRDALKSDGEFRVKEGASVEVAQYNPPFTLPFTRRNEVALEVERKVQ
ncbi:heme-binding-like protein At3g10130, chloroplastic isoform X2 [Rhodamnia argentea]|uniref:Heme-binding-like protein At3g10130, chloroplastic isoform X2 n=1 Tax=Rhodamnia argentea TaxID=178133 RepID=A0ABM3GTQ1_9MYRT|nr:heme-binding-like protein At3g10130, chloroplastic isoform X2 [Rhodamnia argentea]